MSDCTRDSHEATKAVVNESLRTGRRAPITDARDLIASAKPWPSETFLYANCKHCSSTLAFGHDDGGDQ